MQHEQVSADAGKRLLIFRPDSFIDRLDLNTVFLQEQPLEVELGSGDGGFLLAWATRHPNRNFLGIERLLGRLRKLERKGQRAGLTNLRLLRIEASYFLKYLMPPAAVTALHLYFPDPWPKRKHHKNRLVTEEFVQSAAAALAAGGHMYVRTDDEDYFEQIKAVFGADDCFQSDDTLGELREIRTDFEREFRARGLPIFYAAWRRT